LVEVARLPFGLALYDVGKRPDPDLAAVGFARERMVGLHMGPAFIEAASADHGKDQVGIFCRKLAPAFGGAGAHDRGVGGLERLGLEVAFGDLVELALVVERIVLGP
jgi:hypothetical protein